MTAQPVVPPFPLNPFVGQVWLNWIWTGSVWAPTGQGPLMTVKPFFGSALYVPSPNTTFVIVEMVGGGGGGGGALGAYAGGGTAQYINGGGGGGSGAYVRAVLPISLIQPSVPITIGAGGAAGTPTASGGAGGQTSFGSFSRVPGGSGGQPSNAALNQWGVGGAGGSYGVGDQTILGNGGSAGMTTVFQGGTLLSPPAFGGQGGASHFGGAGRQAWALPPTPANGIAGATGAGGGGGASPQTNAPANGGAGGAGFCVVTEWGLGPTSMVAFPCPEAEAA